MLDYKFRVNKQVTINIFTGVLSFSFPLDRRSVLFLSLRYFYILFLGLLTVITRLYACTPFLFILRLVSVIACVRSGRPRSNVTFVSR